MKEELGGSKCGAVVIHLQSIKHPQPLVGQPVPLPLRISVMHTLRVAVIVMSIQVHDVHPQASCRISKILVQQSCQDIIAGYCRQQSRAKSPGVFRLPLHSTTKTISARWTLGLQSQYLWSKQLRQSRRPARLQAGGKISDLGHGVSNLAG